MPTTLRHYDYIAGYYGFGNFGDDVFAQVLANALSRTSWGRPLTSENVGPLRSRILRNACALQNILLSRSITLGGGSILGWTRPCIRHVEMRMSRWSTMPYCAIGVGISEGSKFPPPVVRCMSWIGLRSEREFMILREYADNVHFSWDVAYAAPEIIKELHCTGNGGSEVAVIPSSVGDLAKLAEHPDELRDWIDEYLMPFVHAGNSVKMLLLQPDSLSDTSICGQILTVMRARIEGVRLVVHRTVEETFKEIDRCCFVFTDKLHGAIGAHICGVPFRMSKHHAKCRDFLADVRHPDAEANSSFVRYCDGQEGIRAARCWADKEGARISAYRSRSLSGIQQWLEHLRREVS